MNRIVREHYPVSKLPADLREGLQDTADVRVTIEVPVISDRGAGTEPAAPVGRSFSERFRHLRRANFASPEDVVAYIRSLRDD